MTSPSQRVLPDRSSWPRRRPSLLRRRLPRPRYVELAPSHDLADVSQKEKTETKPKATKAKPAAKKAAPKTTKAKAAPKAKAAAKPKANTATKRAPKAKAPKTEKAAPAVQDAPTVLKKTSSGRVSKQKTTSGAAKAKGPVKKATTAPKRKATPKKLKA